MHTHRFVFLAAYIIGAIALFVFPGFEAKGYIFGSIIGIWPWMLLGEHILDGQTGQTIGLLSVPVVSSIEIYLCAWIMDRRKVTKRLWMALFSAILIGCFWEYLIAGDFERWKAWSLSISPDIPGIEASLSMSNYLQSYLVPNCIVRGMWGLYIMTATGIVCALCMSIRRKTSNNQVHCTSVPPASDSSRSKHGHSVKIFVTSRPRVRFSSNHGEA